MDETLVARGVVDAAGITAAESSGPITIYHLNAAPHPVFWVGFSEATITPFDHRAAAPPAKADDASGAQALA